jgi:excisionase family DNA binding protein
MHDTANTGDGSIYLDTKNAAAYLGLKHHRLQDLRVSGGGPRFTKLGRLVRYRKDWLDAWAEAGACQSTAEARERSQAALTA